MSDDPTQRILDLMRKLQTEVFEALSMAPEMQVPAEIEDLGALIKQRRTMMGLTYGQLEDRAGIKRGIIYQLENNRARRPSVWDLDKVARVLGVPVLHMVTALLRKGEVNGEDAPREDDA